MAEPIVIAPSILSADFSKLGDEIEAVVAAGADWIHCDVMDGHFVPNITFGWDIIRSVRHRTTKPFDVHLMIAPVDPFIEAFAAAGADHIIVHPESGPHFHRTLQSIRGLGKKAGAVICPATHESSLEYVLDDVDLILVMTVNPGFGGQSFIESQVEKVRRIKAMIGDRPIRLEVDGGINPETVKAVARAGADTIVAGSAVFKGGTPDAYRKNIAAIREAAEAARQETLP